MSELPCPDLEACERSFLDEIDMTHVVVDELSDYLVECFERRVSAIGSLVSDRGLSWIVTSDMARSMYILDVAERYGFDNSAQDALSDAFNQYAEALSQDEILSDKIDLPQLVLSSLADSGIMRRWTRGLTSVMLDGLVMYDIPMESRIYRAASLASEYATVFPVFVANIIEDASDETLTKAEEAYEEYVEAVLHRLAEVHQVGEGFRVGVTLLRPVVDTILGRIGETFKEYAASGDDTVSLDFANKVFHKFSIHKDDVISEYLADAFRGHTRGPLDVAFRASDRHSATSLVLSVRNERHIEGVIKDAICAATKYSGVVHDSGRVKETFVSNIFVRYNIRLDVSTIWDLVPILRGASCEGASSYEEQEFRAALCEARRHIECQLDVPKGTSSRIAEILLRTAMTTEYTCAMDKALAVPNLGAKALYGGPKIRRADDSGALASLRAVTRGLGGGFPSLLDHIVLGRRGAKKY